MTRLTLLLALVGCGIDSNLSALNEDVGEPEEEEIVEDVEPETEPEEEPEPEEEQEEPIDEEPEDDDDTTYEDPAPEDDCENTSDLVYAMDRDSETIYLFDPTVPEFTALGTIDCGTWAGTPGSMAISRDGFAYVRYSDGTLYEVDLTTMACSESSWSNSFGSFGMGYATHSSETWREDLFLANSKKLAHLDLTTSSMSVVGSLPSQAELTGNADGELWAFLPLESPALLANLDKDDASILSSLKMPSFPNPYDIDTFAFATWDGDFYLFVRTYGMGSSTDVYHVTPTGSVTLLLEDTGLNVVGAGVSTCAPTGS
jgi:hypothetical protein